MAKKISIKISLIFLCFMMMIPFAGCSSGDADKEFIDFAEIAAEDYLIAVNNRDFNAFSKNLSKEMKELLPEAEFLNFVNHQIEGIIGNYVENSKDFIKTEKESGYIWVIYNAKYTDEPAGVEVKIVLQKVDGEIKIAGSWFDSPKLRGE
ncbi:MAG: DUF3887 domain-containing protein [Actinomycetia bacterium]|nr:DUF3887 domain-containing protein [Actinomycetes bacterium]